MLMYIKVLLVCFMCIVFCATHAQDHSKEGKTYIEIDSLTAGKGLKWSILKFEPSFEASVAAKKEIDIYNNTVLDTLVLSDRKKRRLRKRRFQSNFSEQLSKAAMADTKFEEEND